MATLCSKSFRGWRQALKPHSRTDFSLASLLWQGWKLFHDGVLSSDTATEPATGLKMPQLLHISHAQVAVLWFCYTLISFMVFLCFTSLIMVATYTTNDCNKASDQWRLRLYSLIHRCCLNTCRGCCIQLPMPRGTCIAPLTRLLVCCQCFHG
jgi:hypothetical protein